MNAKKEVSDIANLINYQDRYYCVPPGVDGKIDNTVGGRTVLASDSAEGLFNELVEEA